MVEEWTREVGWEPLMNRAGTTFRKLADADKTNLDEKKALADTEVFDPARFAQLQRQPPYNVAAAARVPTGSMPNFGSMPPMAGGLGGMGFNGQGGQR